jgi:deoxyribonuclease V
MSITPSLPWTYDFDQAIRLQQNLSKRVALTWDERRVQTVAGIDVSVAGVIVHAAVSVLCFPELTRVTAVTGEAPQGFPYIPGMLAFQVGPAILEAWEKLKLTPDLVMIHGHGIAHPRGFGLASHVGLWLNIPTLGVAKTRLYGKFTEVAPRAGEWSEIHSEHDPGRIIGAALRTQADVKPVYVSPGHLIDLPHCIEYVLASCRNHRMPEPLRLAHEAATGTYTRSRKETQIA